MNVIMNRMNKRQHNLRIIGGVFLVCMAMAVDSWLITLPIAIIGAFVFPFIFEQTLVE